MDRRCRKLVGDVCKIGTQGKMEKTRRSEYFSIRFVSNGGLFLVNIQEIRNLITYDNSPARKVP